MNTSTLFRVRSLLGAAALMSLVACGDDPEENNNNNNNNNQPLVCDAAAYQKGVQKASEPTSASVSTSLWAINASNTKLKWSEDKSAVLMVAWTTFKGYTPGDNTLSREIWVTAVPQVQELCRTVKAEELVPRMNQYLGLPPAAQSDFDNRIFVELWVKPADMFRPCPDAEIDDGTCGLEFPQEATADHKNWINANYASSYGFWQKTQYPWTGLGYTYDWCNANTAVGASEFVVRKGSIVNVKGYTERAVYCAQ
ncbi:hypothetical protein P2318_05795 [Myxococcaceae bacterium GXIMD 01537]